MSDCVWKQDEDGNWLGTCGIAWVLGDCGDGTPRDHGMNYCPRCGKPLSWAAYQEPANEDD